MLAIVDFDIGNLAAVANMLRRIGHPCEVTANPDLLVKATHLILPGNGAFDACMRNLRATGLIPLLTERVFDHKVPLLGICVGAQMLGHGSEEGGEPGLGWLDMRARRFPTKPGFRIPHMGWNNVKSVNANHPLTKAWDPGARFYFVHSFYLDPADSADVLLQCSYGIEFAAGVARANIAGVQFHPEKSHRFGKGLLGAFLGMGR